MPYYPGAPNFRSIYVQFMHSVHVVKHELEGKNIFCHASHCKLFVLQNLPITSLQFMRVTLSNLEGKNLFVIQFMLMTQSNPVVIQFMHSVIVYVPMH